MVFIFGNLGATDYLTDESRAVINETEAYANGTAYIVDGASDIGASSFVLTSAWMRTNESGPYDYQVTDLANNLTLSSAGSLTNLTALNYTLQSNMSVSYTYTRHTEAEIVSDSVTNDSLRAIGSYAEQSGTQFTTLGIAITLILLVAVFLFFWKSFMGKEKGSGPGSFS